VDVLAAKDSRVCVIECKHHTDGDKPDDIKIALYVHSRFNDIRKAMELSPDYNSFAHEGWLVTNTRCSSDAITYAECAGLKILSWKYPEPEGLELMIERKRLYPVTILPAATRNAMHVLTQNNIIMMQEIVDMEESAFIRKSGLDRNSAIAIKREADDICSHLLNGLNHNSGEGSEKYAVGS
jgi:hypothetical protein